MLLIRITDSTLSLEDRPAPTLDHLQRLIGGSLEAAFTIRNPCGEGDVIGYGNADSIGLRPNVLLGDTVIGGPVIVLGVGPHGEHRSLTHQEVDRFELQPIEGSAVPELVVYDSDS